MKTPSAFEGYINNPEATEETLRFDEDGQKWLMTGDIVYIDDNDNLFLVDRKKELLKYKGHQVMSVILVLFKCQNGFEHKSSFDTYSWLMSQGF